MLAPRFLHPSRSLAMSRQEHLSWCKSRALSYLPDSPQEAVTSMLSDLGKHPETKGLIEGPLAMIGLLVASHNNATEAKSFIEGFN